MPTSVWINTTGSCSSFMWTRNEPNEKTNRGE
jgi:hypothetical protein